MTRSTTTTSAKKAGTKTTAGQTADKTAGQAAATQHPARRRAPAQRRIPVQYTPRIPTARCPGC